MKRPSNIIIAFVLAVAACFMTWIGWLLFAQIFGQPEVEIEDDIESQLDTRFKIASQVNSNNLVRE